MDKVVKLLGLSSLLLFSMVAVSTAETSFSQRSDLNEFINEMANEIAKILNLEKKR